MLAALCTACGSSDSAVVPDAPVPVPDAPATDGPPASTDFRGGTVYEIFVRSFADSDGNGIGDLAGLTARIDYLNDGDPDSTTSLGVDAVWLMPIFPSPSYHGYDVSDYRNVNPSYGSLADFDAFVAAAHQRGISVVLDMVVNHASSQHPDFVDSASNPTSAKRNFFVWSDTDLHWQRPWEPVDAWYGRNGAFYYGLFCNCMPDWNLANPDVESQRTDDEKFWLARGVDGFRLDAARYYIESPTGDLADQPETHAYLRRMRQSLQAVAPTMVLIGEIYTAVEIQASYYGQGDELQLAFSFNLADAFIAAAQAGDASSIINILARTEAAFVGKDRSYEAPFLSNHDQVRVMRAIGNDTAAARVAAASLFAMPGTPFIYYGEELGMLGGPGGSDENKRTPFHWTGASPGYGFTTGTPWYSSAAEVAGVDVASEQADPGSLWHLYRQLIALRHGQPALSSGSATRPAVTGGGSGVLALVRASASGQRVLFVANFGTAETGPFTVTLAGTPSVLLGEGVMGTPSSAAGAVTVPNLLARGFAYVALD